jgi:hypothetical protein
MYRVWERGQRTLLEIFSDTTLDEIARSKPPGAIAPDVPEAAAASDKS